VVAIPEEIKPSSAVTLLEIYSENSAPAKTDKASLQAEVSVSN